MGALLALIPPKDWFIGAAFAILAVMGWHYWDKYHDAVAYADTVKAESAAAAKDAQFRLSMVTATYNDSLRTLKEASDAALKAAADQHSADVGRLRTLSADRTNDPVLHGSAGTAAEAAAWARRLDALESISLGLANALRFDDAAALECWRERDSLTGK